MVKLYSDRLEISNNGEFIGGITPDNILHHQPAARNPLMVEALTRLRLVNRSNLRVSRMYTSSDYPKSWTVYMAQREPHLYNEFKPGCKKRFTTFYGFVAKSGLKTEDFISNFLQR